MMDHKLHTPEGVKDYLPEEYALKKQIETNVQAVFERCGYKAVETPTFEFIQVYEGTYGVNDKRMYKLLDRDGSILGLRSDFTPAIARIAATAYTAADIPLRFAYSGNCFRYNENYQGKMREFTQAGIELIGVNGVEADAEVIAAAVEALLAAGLDEFRVDIGNVSFLQGVLDESGISADECEKIRESITAKDYVAVNGIVSGLEIKAELKELLNDLPLLIGDIDLIEKVKGMVKNERSLAALSHLHKIYDIIKEKGHENHISFDLSVIGQMDYYTGMVFRAYARGTGFSVADGGRYDNLVKNFGADYPAVGFSMNINNVMAAVSNRKEKGAE